MALDKASLQAIVDNPESSSSQVERAKALLAEIGSAGSTIEGDGLLVQLRRKVLNRLLAEKDFKTIADLVPNWPNWRRRDSRLTPVSGGECDYR